MPALPTAFLAAVAVATAAASPSAASRPVAAAPVRETSPGVYLVMRSRDREQVLPTVSLVPAGRPGDGNAGEWANTTRCDPRGYMVDGNLCVQYFMSGQKVPIRAPYVAHGAVLPVLTMLDGAPLGASEASSLARSLAGGDRVEVVEIESEVGSRLKSPWGAESIYPHLHLQDSVGGACGCVMGLRRVSKEGRVLWSYAYFWHPGGSAEARGPMDGDPIPEPVLALNQFAMPQRSDVVLATSGATLFGRTGTGPESRWPQLVVSIAVATGRPTSDPKGFQPVPFEDLVQFTVDHLSERFRRGLVKEDESSVTNGRRDIDVADDFAHRFDEHVLKAAPALQDRWAP